MSDHEKNNAVTFPQFYATVKELVSRFQKQQSYYKSKPYDEAAVRNDFLNPFWRAMGWDMENIKGLSQPIREVEVESRVDIAGRKKKADYLFRTDGLNRFVCEAKKPIEELARFAFQVQRYAFNLQAHIAILSNFEEFFIYAVGGKPRPQAPFEPVSKYHFHQYPLIAEQLWSLFSRDQVASGSLDKFISELPKRAIKGRARQGWLIRPERIRRVDIEFLRYMEESRKQLARHLVKDNPKQAWNENNLNEAVQRILDRILFIRICEDRDIDLNGTLESIVQAWKNQPVQQPLYPLLVNLFRAMDKGRERSFNGGLFAPHFSEALKVSDGFLLDFIGELSGDESPYLFNIIPVEIIGSIYERFIEKRIRVSPGGRLQVADKFKLRKAEGVYYTPQYIVNFIVKNTVGELIKDKSPEQVSMLKILDPACGSGSFLIGIFDCLCQYYKDWLIRNPKKQTPDLCWYDTDGNLHLTTGLKRQIALNNIYGVDLDPQAVEVSQFSLYLKILEGENRMSLAAQHPLFKGETILPNLKNNIKLGNSLIESDYFDLFSNGDELTRIRPLDWKAAFPEIFKNGGFDAVIGNPPWGQKAVDFTPEEKEYFKSHYETAVGILDLFKLFSERALKITRDQGYWAMILPDIILLKNYPEIRKYILDRSLIKWIGYAGMAFENVNIDSVVLVCLKTRPLLSPRHNINILMNVPSRSMQKIKPDRKTPQALFLKLQDYKFNIHLDADKIALLDKLNKLPRLSEFLEAHEGIHSGNVRKKLFLSKRKNRFCRKMIFGREEINRYELNWAGKWVNCNPAIINKSAGEYANLGHERYFTSPKIFVRRTGDYVMAVPDYDGFFASNNLFVLLEKDRPTQESGETKRPDNLLYFTGLLNSRLITWYFRTIQPRVGKLFAELKINHIHDFPLPLPNSNDSREYVQMVSLVKRNMEFLARLGKTTSEHDRKVLDSAIQATEHSINQLTCEIYNLHGHEIEMTEKDLTAYPIPSNGARSANPHCPPKSRPKLF